MLISIRSALVRHQNNHDHSPDRKITRSSLIRERETLQAGALTSSQCCESSEPWHVTFFSSCIKLLLLSNLPFGRDLQRRFQLSPRMRQGETKEKPKESQLWSFSVHFVSLSWFHHFYLGVFWRVFLFGWFFVLFLFFAISLFSQLLSVTNVNLSYGPSWWHGGNLLWGSPNSQLSSSSSGCVSFQSACPRAHATISLACSQPLRTHLIICHR